MSSLVDGDPIDATHWLALDDLGCEWNRDEEVLPRVGKHPYRKPFPIGPKFPSEDPDVVQPEGEEDGMWVHIDEDENDAPSPRAVVSIYNVQAGHVPAFGVQYRLTDRLRERIKTIQEREQMFTKRAAWWIAFGMAADSPFLRGEVSDFRASLGWLLGEDRSGELNIVKVWEGRYAPRRDKGDEDDLLGSTSAPGLSSQDWTGVSRDPSKHARLFGHDSANEDEGGG